MNAVERVKQALIDQGKATTKADLEVYETRVARALTLEMQGQAQAAGLPEDEVRRVRGAGKQHIELKTADIIELAKLSPRDPICEQLRLGSERAGVPKVVVQVDSILHALEEAEKA